MNVIVKRLTKGLQKTIYLCVLSFTFAKIDALHHTFPFKNLDHIIPIVKKLLIICYDILLLEFFKEYAILITWGEPQTSYPADIGKYISILSIASMKDVHLC